MASESSDQLKLIYLDKNYPPAEIKITIEAIKEQAKRLNADIKRVALVPQTSAQLDYPFSLNYLVQCYVRCLERSGHITMSNEHPERLAKILVLFCQQFKGFTFDESFEREFGFDSMIKANFTMEEHQDVQLPRNIEATLKECLNSPDTKQLDSPIEEFCRLMQLYRTFFAGGCTGQSSDANASKIASFMSDLTQASKAEHQKRVEEARAAAAKNAASISIDGAIEERDEESDDEEENDLAEHDRKMKTVEQELATSSKRAAASEQKQAKKAQAEPKPKAKKPSKVAVSLEDDF